MTFWKSELIDYVILQQDAFDAVDAVCPLERQEYMMDLVVSICHSEFKFETFLEVMDYFKKLINILKQMNFACFKSKEFNEFDAQFKQLLSEKIEK